MRTILLLISFFCVFSQVSISGNLKFHTLSHRGGLSYDGVIDIKQDGKGFMWILLGRNLYRFDGYSYKSYRDDFFNTFENQIGYFNSLETDRNGNLYISFSQGLYQYDFKMDGFTQINDLSIFHTHVDKNNTIWICTKDDISYLGEENKVMTPDFNGNLGSFHKQIIAEDENDLYFFSYYGKIYKYNQSDKKIELWANFEQDFENGNLVDATIKDGVLWLLTNKFSIMKIDLQTGKMTYKHTFLSGNDLNIRCLYVSDDGLAWVGTMYGLYILNTETGTLTTHLNNIDDRYSLPNNSIWSINEDNNKNIWIGTYMGSIVYVNRHEDKIFDTYNFAPNGLNRVPVSGFAEAGDRIWVSTEGGGISIFDKEEHTFTHIPFNQDRRSLSSGSTKNSVVDSRGNVWIPTFRGGLNRYDPTTQQFTHFLKQKDDKTSIYSNNLRKIVLEGDSGLWVIYQEHTTTLSFFSFKENRFYHRAIFEDMESSMDYDYIYDAYRDNKDQLWVITSNWLFMLDMKSNTWKRYQIPAKHNPASTLCVDDNEIVWIGTFGNELVHFNPKDASFLSIPSILQSEIAEIYSINYNIDHNGEQIIWLGSNDGLYMYNTKTHSCSVFRESDGTQGDIYYPLATLKGKDGALYFGGTGGFTIIAPKRVRFNTLKPRAIVSDFYIDNQSVFNKNGHKKDIDFFNTPYKIKLDHRQQNFGFKLASDNYLNADKNLFRYRLKNYDDRWIQTDASNRMVFYSKIPAGRYVFELQAANNDGLWGDITSIRILRKQSPWLSIPALTLYFLLVCGLLYYFSASYKTQKELELQLYLDQVEKEKNEEIHNNQLQFFTNISHDLKTPLSLIMITINKMREEGMREYYYRILNNNSERLLRLLNDILDFRKIQNNKVNLSVTEGNLSDFIQTISSDFSEYANHKEINYQIITDDEALSNVPFDKKVMEKIIMNLLVNAFKYTRKGDSISIMAGVKKFISKYPNSYSFGYNDLSNHNTCFIVVSDTGVGISKDSISKVFDQFYQAESQNQHSHLGTGIGLALVKNLVLLHKGCITIYSERNVGSDFVIEMSLDPQHYLPGEMAQKNTPHGKRVDAGKAFTKNKDYIYPEDIDQTYPDCNYKNAIKNDLANEDTMKEKTILLVEDSIDLRMIINASLTKKYNVIDFGDGKPALEFLNENDVDLIISDIMMPEMDGITFCKAVKGSIETSHIPFIMLTAKSGLASMLEGTESGADLYFEKPVDLTLLKTAISNIFKQQEVLREYYAKNYFADLTNVSSNKQDQQFLNEVSQIIDEYLDQPELDVNTIASRMMMSRSKLYSKIKTLTGKSVVEFILNYRLRKAAKLLIDSNMNIQQAMYAVGIESRSYFTKAFKKEFNMTPSQFVLKKKDNQ